MDGLVTLHAAALVFSLTPIHLTRNNLGVNSAVCADGRRHSPPSNQRHLGVNNQRERVPAANRKSRPGVGTSGVGSKARRAPTASATGAPQYACPQDSGLMMSGSPSVSLLELGDRQVNSQRAVGRLFVLNLAMTRAGACAPAGHGHGVVEGLSKKSLGSGDRLLSPYVPLPQPLRARDR